MRRLSSPAIVFAAALMLSLGMYPPASARAQDGPLGVIGAPPDVALGARLHALAPALARLAGATPGLFAVSVGDLRTGHAIAVNGGLNLPAASTIKIPVMV